MPAIAEGDAMWPRLTSILRGGFVLLVIGSGCITFAAAQAQGQSQELDERLVILAIGESTTAGFGVATADSYPAQLQRLLDEHGYVWRVVNHGRSGSTTSMALSGLDRGMLLQPEIVLIALGGNDQGKLAAARTKENLRKLITMFTRTGALVVLAERNSAADRANAAESSLYAQLAEEEGVLLMPSLREGVAGHPELLLADDSHPNAAGYTLVAQRIFTILQPYLNKIETESSASP